MKQRILNKKLKNDSLIQLWIKHWQHSTDLMFRLMMCITTEKYNDHTSIWYCRFKCVGWMMDYEIKQIIKYGKMKYPVR